MKQCSMRGHVLVGRIGVGMVEHSHGAKSAESELEGVFERGGRERNLVI